MARLGSVAAAPFRGDQFASLYLGATRVPTVPGPPTITSAVRDDGTLSVTSPVPSDGGDAISNYRIYVDGELLGTLDSNPGNPILLESVVAESLVGDTVRLSAINAIGEGPLSAPVIVT
jgi:hypothetical protein